MANHWRSKRKYDATQRLAERLRDCYRRTVHVQSTADEHQARVTREVYQDPAYPMITQAQREYLRGIGDTLRGQLWEHNVIWRLGPADGPLPEGVDGWHPIDVAPLSVLCKRPGELYGGHFWKGTEKPWTEYRCTNAAKPEVTQ